MRVRLAARFARSLVAAVGFVAALPVVSAAQEIDCDRATDREVRSLQFEGNQTFNDDELSARVLTTPSSLTRRWLGWLRVGTRYCYPSEGLRPDVDILKLWYKNNGFYEAKVDTVVQSAGPRAVKVTFRIDEGPPMLTDSLTITGLDSIADTTAILRDLPLQVGERFGDLQLLAEMDTITARLRNAGYPRAEVLRYYRVNPEQHRAYVELQVSAGPRARFGVINIQRTGIRPSGAEIDSAVVLGLLGLQTGDWYSDRAITDASRSLYNLGTYRHVGIEPDTTRPAPDTLVNLLVDVREDYMHEIRSEEGWANLDCFRIDAGYTDKNFLKDALRLDLTGRVSKLGYGEPTGSKTTRNLCYRPQLDQDSIGSSKLNYYLGASVRQPTLFGGYWVPTYSAYTSVQGQFKAYLRTTLLGLDASATRNLGDRMPLRLGYTLEFGRTKAEPLFLCSLFSLCDDTTRADISRNLRLGVASANFQRNRIDNQVDPRTGYTLATEFRMSERFTGSNASQAFYKLTADGAKYFALTSRTTFVARLRGGLIVGGRTAGTRLPPPQERLYAGGATTVRGFQQNELGPLIHLLDADSFDTVAVPGSPDPTVVALVAKPDADARRTIPTGGSRLIVMSVEVRIRDPFFPELLEYVPFFDAGQVTTNEARGLSGLNLDRLAYTPGIGIRYFSPVGPIQFNVGYNPSRVRSGPAYYGAQRLDGTSPLICVTAPGVDLVPVKIDADGFQNISGTCPASFTPARKNTFLNHLAFTLSFHTGF